MGPDRTQEMIRAMQGHSAELARNYDAATLPQRPVDAVLEGATPENMANSDALVRAMQAQDFTGPGFQPSPTLGMSPQELGIGPSPEWMAQDDARMVALDQQRDEGAFLRAMRRAARKLKMQQHSDEFNSPEIQQENAGLWQEFHAAKGAQ